MIVMDNTDTERIGRIFLIFALNILKKIFFFQDYTTPSLTPHVSDSSTSEYFDLEVLIFLDKKSHKIC